MKKSVRALILAAAALLVATSFFGCGSHQSSSSSTETSKNANSLQPEPDVTFKDLQGKDVPLASYKGKVVLVNFWGTWCAPCRGEIPILIDLQDKYSGQGFTLLGVATNDQADVVTPFVHNTKFAVNGQSVTMNYPIVMGNDDIDTKFGGLIGMPTTFLISRDGKIVKRYIGALANSTQIEKDIQSQL